MKRMSGGGGPMGVGKSNAKVYVQKETGVTFKDVAGENGTVDAEKVKAAINKVLEDVPALKPAGNGETNNQGFKPIGVPNNNNNQNQDDLLRGIFGIKKK